MSAQSRTALRRQIKTSDGWNAYRRTHNLDLATMTMAELKATASALANGHNDNGFTFEGETQSETGNDYENSYELYDSSHTETVKATSDKASESASSLLESKSDESLSDAERQLLALLRQPKQAAIDPAEIERQVNAAVRKAVSQLGVVKIEVTSNGRKTFETKEGEHVHPLFATLVKALSAKQANGTYPNVWIAGPTASGKTHSAQQAAKALDLAFYSQGACCMAFEVTGFVDGHGTYHETQFVKAFRDGGVILMDEIDAGDNPALLALNAALANGFMTLPTGEQIKRHADFRCIGAANTFGHGATADYIGRCKIDAAFLSRFPVKLYWDYDKKLERAISGDADFAELVQDARRAAADAGLKVTIDPRQSQAGAALIAAGMTQKEAAELTFLSGLSDDQKAIIKRKITFTTATAE